MTANSIGVKNANQTVSEQEIEQYLCRFRGQASLFPTMSIPNFPTLPSKAATKLRGLLDEACSGENPKVAGTVMQVVNSSGGAVFVHTAGNIAAVSYNEQMEECRSRPIKVDDILPLLSNTKLSIAVATLQFVEKGLINLDDPTLIEKYLPELMAKEVLLRFEDHEPGDTRARIPILEKRKGCITARMLLTNTAGLSYTFFSPLLFEYIGFSIDKTEAIDPWACMKATPLIAQPGTRWSYGQSLDWMSVLIERLITTTMKEHLDIHIYRPLSMYDTFLDIEIESISPLRVVPLNFKSTDGKFTCIPHSVRRVKSDDTITSEGLKQPYWGGGWIFSSAEDFSRLLAALLNHGKCEVTGNRILSPESVASMFTPAFAEHFVPGLIETTMPGAFPVNLKDLDPNINSGFGCAIQGSDRIQPNGKPGRRAGSAYWFGGMNTNWWLDPKSGIAVVIFSCSAPWNEPAWLSLVSDLEGELYDGLQW